MKKQTEYKQEQQTTQIPEDAVMFPGCYQVVITDNFGGYNSWISSNEDGSGMRNRSCGKSSIASMYARNGDLDTANKILEAVGEENER